MKREHMFRTVALVFLTVLALYLGAFYGIEHLRHRKGAWEVTFRNDPAGRPAVVLNQAHHGIKDVTVLFTGVAAGTNLPQRLVFTRSAKILPFGSLVSEPDLLYLPGSITFWFYGHEVAVVPRVLFIDGKERPWRSGEVIELAGNTNPPPPAPSTGRRR